MAKDNDAPNDGNASIAIPGVSAAIENMPEPQQHAIDEAARQDAAIANANEGVTDKSGAKFDASVHWADEHGKGKFNAAGLWTKKRGRKAGEQTASVAPGSRSTAPAKPGQKTEAQKTAETQAELLAKASAAGTMAAESVFMICRSLGGEEWKPIQKDGVDERKVQTDAWTAYFVATGKVDFPPGVMLLIALGSYAAPRFSMPKTQARVLSLKERVVLWFVRRKEKKAAQRGETPTSELGVQS